MKKHEKEKCKNVHWYFGKAFEIPKTWKIDFFSKGIKFLTDYESNGSYAKLDEFAKVGVGKPHAWFVRSTDLEKGRIGLVDGNKFVNKESYEFLKKTKLYGNEFLMMKVGSVGKVYYFPKIDCHATLGNNLYLIHTNDKLNSKFAYYWFTSTLGLASLFRIASTTTLPSINKDNTKKCLMLYPSIDEQEKIVSILSNLDSLIENIQSRIEKIQNLKKGLLKEFLFKGINHIKFQNTEWLFNTNISFPSSWSKTSLKQLILKSKNGFTGQPNDNSLGVPRLGINSISDSNSVYVNEQTYRFIEIDKSKINPFLVQKNDLLVCRQNGNKDNVGKIRVIQGLKSPIIFSDSLILLKVDLKKIIPEYLTMFMDSQEGKKQISKFLGTTAGNYSINATEFKKMQILLPPISEQKEIVSIILKIESIIKTHEEYKSKLEILKKGLMQKLLTGGIRVKV